MKIIFLDIDGVLCIRNQFSDNCLTQLKRIVDVTDAKIVLSSDWRFYRESQKQVNAILSKYKISEFLDTISLVCRDMPRYEEIDDYLIDKSHIKQYAIIDDWMAAKQPHSPDNFFKTSSEIGLTLEIADSIIAHLNKITQ